jgi:V8-like Glu-specific endopeptidase
MLTTPVQAEELDPRVGEISGTMDGSNIRHNCTATLLKNDYLITAISCLYHPKTGEKYDQLEFFPPKTGKLDRYSRAFINEGWYAAGYGKHLQAHMGSTIGDDRFSTKSDGMIANDIAILKAEFPVGNRTLTNKLGSYGYAHLDTKISDFPINITSSNLYKNSKYQTKQSCEATSDTSMFHHLSLNCNDNKGKTGSPVFYKTEDNRSLIFGIVSGSYGEKKQKNVLKTSVIHKSLNNEIDKITEGETANLKYFSNHKYDTKKRLYLGIQNDCKEEIQIALRYRDLENNWVTKGFYRLDPHTSINKKFPTNNWVFYYYAASTESNMEWEGTDNYRTLYGKQYGFTKQEVSRDGDLYFTITCGQN